MADITRQYTSGDVQLGFSLDLHDPEQTLTVTINGVSMQLNARYAIELQTYLTNNYHKLYELTKDVRYAPADGDYMIEARDMDDENFKVWRYGNGAWQGPDLIDESKMYQLIAPLHLIHTFQSFDFWRA